MRRISCFKGVRLKCNTQCQVSQRRYLSNMALAMDESGDVMMQPLGVQNLLNDGNLHDVYKKYLNRMTYSATLEPMESAWSLFPEVYVDPAFQRIEREKVFKQSWTAIDHKSDFLQNHGDVLSTLIGDVPILIANDHGNLRGFYNVCRHRGSILLKSGKYSKCNVIRCPYHSWGYSCSGKLMGAPYFNDDKMPKNKAQRTNVESTNHLTSFDKINFNKHEYNLFEFGVRELMGTIFVSLEPDQSKREKLWEYQFGDLSMRYGHYPYHEMRIIEQFEYKIQSNWKLVAENFMEYYHLPWVHPELCQVSSVANHVRKQGDGQYVAFATYPLSKGGTAADPDVFPAFNGLTETDLNAAYFIHIFPNISYFIFPHHIVSLIVFPTNEPGVTYEKFTVLMDNQIKDDQKVKELVDFYVLINNQDIEAVENVQRGIAAQNVYRGGRLSAKFEEPVYRFQHILVDYLTDNQMRPYPGDSASDFI